jgi:hypothetical protein
MQLQDEEGQNWYFKSDPGTVLLKRTPITYDIGTRNLQSFSNTHSGNVYMLPSSTHVSVGFVDLGELAAAVSQWEGEQPLQKQPGGIPWPQAQDTTPESAVSVKQLLQRAFELDHNSSSSSSSSSTSGSNTSQSAVGPLQWLGYDASPYAVAKTAVLLEMMKQGAETDAVLQVTFAGLQCA